MAFTRGSSPALLLLAFVPAILGVNWATESLADNAHLYPCVGENIDLNWILNETTKSDKVLFEQWTFNNQPVASVNDGHLHVFFKYQGHIAQLGEAGLSIKNIVKSDMGTWRVKIMINTANGVEVLDRSATVVIGDGPFTKGPMALTQARLAAQDKQDGRWKTSLKCGEFTQEQFPFDPVWTTPSGDELKTVKYEGGFYIALLDTPDAGNYSCAIPEPALPSKCAPKQFSASTTLDRTEARLDVLEAQQAETTKKLSELAQKQKNASVTVTPGSGISDADVTALKAAIQNQTDVSNALDQVTTQLTQAIGSQDKALSDLGDKIDLLQGAQAQCAEDTDALNATIQRIDVRVAFFARTLTNYEPAEGETLVFPEVQLNDGNGYNGTTGVFTTPVTGVYILMAMMQGHGDEGDNFQVEMVVDGVKKVDMFKDATMNDEDHNSSISIVTRLEAGQKVWFRTEDDETEFDKDPKWAKGNSFSGSLIKAD